MIDVHCHIIPNVDDGSESLEESIEMAKIAENSGIKIIINTSHYHLDSDFIKGKELENKILEFNNILKENNISIEVLIGNELYYSRNLISKLDELDFYTLGKTRYILIEFPSDNVPDNMEDIIYEFKIRKYIPIIAHVERYDSTINNINRVYDYINYGALIQVNSSSIIGKLGKDIKNAADILLTHNMVHFIGSDGHGSKRRRPSLNESYEYIKNLIGKEKADKIFYENTNDLLQNKDLKIASPVKYEKKSILTILKKLFQ